jgi:hypothetical protein
LVRIDAPRVNRDLLTALGDAVHRAMIDALAIPAQDRFQVLRGASDQPVIFDPGYLGFAGPSRQAEAPLLPAAQLAPQ